jgi:hypothetical protein
MLLICGEGKAGYFSREGWTGRIRLMRLVKLAFVNNGICSRSAHGSPLIATQLVRSQRHLFRPESRPSAVTLSLVVHASERT